MLLDDFGVIRHRPNGDGLTAYQLAKNESVRQLFYRPSEDRLLRYVQSVPEQGDLQLNLIGSEDENQTDIGDQTDDQYGIHSRSNAIDYILRKMLQLNSLHIHIQQRNSPAITIEWLEQQHIRFNYSNYIIINVGQDHYSWL
ncbi:unnamed protein product [Rotaria sordida]|uniref:Uncharacterized protein n=1 Tax=Rotaria sordida TaxID=392033 RepID=A0A815EUU0_9BILA|nr:unnamed protein product [Rotaria sordida]CAF1582584.1 unnamed protein product [Rotaria sordida]